MKASFIVIAFGLVAGLAQAAETKTTLIRATSIEDAGKRQIYMGTGVSETSFSFYDNTEQSYCYLGRAADVCGIFRAYESWMQNQYTSGDHDTIELKGCVVKKDAVEVALNLTDDYGGDINVVRVVRDCAKN